MNIIIEGKSSTCSTILALPIVILVTVQCWPPPMLGVVLVLRQPQQKLESYVGAVSVLCGSQLTSDSDIYGILVPMTLLFLHRALKVQQDALDMYKHADTIQTIVPLIY